MPAGLAAIFFSSFTVALSGALMPGPFLTATISESSRRGAVAGPLMVLGHGILELALVLALLTGLAPLFNNDRVFAAIALAGGIILVWMSLSMFRGLAGLRLAGQGETARRHNLILAGILFSLANPYWAIWWATIGLGYIMHAVILGPLGVMTFFCGHILADLAWYSLVSYGIARGRGFFGDRFYRGLIAACASFLLVFAGYFFYSGLTRLT
ncbi:MAG: LysE family translocator [Thermodesulfobacteriota bacterium]